MSADAINPAASTPTTDDNGSFWPTLEHWSMEIR